MNKILFICSGHQDTEAKLEYVLSNLKELSGHNIDICYVTHSTNGLDKISEYCKYVHYDSNNLFPNESDLFNNLEFIPEERFKFSLTSYYSLPFGRLNNRLFLTHSKPALSNFKNGVYVAKSNNYDWIVYFEYDAVIPEINLYNYFNSRIDYLKSQDLIGDFYHCEGDRFPLIWPHFFVCKPDVFLDDEYFNLDFSTSESFVKIYANQFFEQILTEITDKNSEKLIIRRGGDILNDFNFKDYDLNSISDQGVLSKFSLGDKKKDENDDALNHYPWFIEIYPRSIEDRNDILLVIYSGNTNKNEVYKLNYLKITDDSQNVLVIIENQELLLGNWYTYNVLSQYKVKDISENIHIEYSIEKVNVRCVNIKYKLNLNSIEKYKNIKFIS
jgi:hypothetical protein